MLDKDVIIKFKDYLDIKKTSSKSFAVTNKGKISNYKGERTELYILPIFDELFQYNTCQSLFEKIKDKNINKDNIVFDEFLEVIDVLFKGNLIEIYNGETASREIRGKAGLYGSSYDFYKKYLVDKKIAIINLTYESDVQLLINELKVLSLKSIDLVNFCNEQYKAKIKNENNLENITIVDKHYSDIELYFDNMDQNWDLVILYNSATNYSISKNLYKKLINKNIPFINCITNDFEIVVGPLTVAHKTSCPQCSDFNGGHKYSVVNNINEEEFKSYRVNRRAMSLISAALLIDEITKYLTMNILLTPPLTLNHKLVIKGLDFEHKREEIIQNPLCNICKAN